MNAEDAVVGFNDFLAMDIPAPECAATHVTIMQQPAAEVTKNQYFELSVAVHNCTCSADKQSAPRAELLYDGEDCVVPPASGQEVLEGCSSWDGIKFTYRLRINELSRAHRNRLFKIRFRHGYSQCETRGVKVLSKSSIVRAHAEGSVATSSRVKRSREDDAAAGAVAEMKRMCVEIRERVTASQAKTQTQLLGLQQQITAMSQQMDMLVQALLPPPPSSSPLQQQQQQQQQHLRDKPFDEIGGMFGALGDVRELEQLGIFTGKVSDIA